MAASAALHRLRLDLERLPAEIVADVGDVIRTALLDEARRAIGADLRISGVSWMNFALDVNLAVTKAGPESVATLTPAPIFGGPAIWSWIEFGTKTHEIGTGASKTWPTRRRRLRIGGNWVTGPVTVRGMAAQHRWTRGVETGTKTALENVRQLMENATHG